METGRITPLSTTAAPGATIPAGGIVLNQPENEKDPTIVMMAVGSLGLIDRKLPTLKEGAAKAEMTLAKRHLEDAIMRVNRAFAIEAGMLQISDIEAMLT